MCVSTGYPWFKDEPTQDGFLLCWLTAGSLENEKGHIYFLISTVLVRFLKQNGLDSLCLPKGEVLI